MKTWFVLFVSAFFAIALPGQTSSPAGKTGTGKAEPGKAAKKEEPPPKIEGQEVSRGEKGYLGVQIADGKFKLNFYDKEKKPTKPDVGRAVLRWDPKYKVGMERVVLNPGGENFLTSDRFIRPPYTFKLFMVLLKDSAGGDDAVGESYVIDFRQ